MLKLFVVLVAVSAVTANHQPIAFADNSRFGTFIEKPVITPIWSTILGTNTPILAPNSFGTIIGKPVTTKVAAFPVRFNDFLIPPLVDFNAPRDELVKQRDYLITLLDQTKQKEFVVPTTTGPVLVSSESVYADRWINIVTQVASAITKTLRERLPGPDGSDGLEIDLFQ